MGLTLHFHTSRRATPKKARLRRLVREISATERQEAAMRPMTAGRMPARASFRWTLSLNFVK